ncbi:MAG: lysylphosphatidylglycerol synthase transmembrane domain-containing protein [Elusimicrobiota bacterium]
MKKRIFFGILVSIIFLYPVLRNINFQNLFGIISNGQYIWILPCIVIYTLAFGFRAIRWTYLFRPVKKFTATQLFSSLIMGFAANNIFPIRIGEIVRAYIVGKKYDVSKGASLATIILERIMDGVAVLILLGLAIPFIPKVPIWTRKMSVYAIILFVGALGVAVAIITKKNSVNYLWKLPFIKYELKAKIINKLVKFITGFEALKDIFGFVMIIFLSICVWLCETLNIFFMVKIVNINLPITVMVFVIFAAVIGVTIPAAPGAIGTFEFFYVASMMFFGISKDKALASALIIHAIGMTYILLLGGYYFVKEGVSYKEIASVS